MNTFFERTISQRFQENVQQNMAKTSKTGHTKEERKVHKSPNSMNAGVGLRLHGNEVPW